MPIMRYTNSEIREMMKRVKRDLKSLTREIPRANDNRLSVTLIRRSLESLRVILDKLRLHIIDNTDIQRANELGGLVLPVWNEYWGKIEQGEIEPYDETFAVKDILDDLRDWMKEEHQRQMEALKKMIKEAEECPIEVEVAVEDQEGNPEQPEMPKPKKKPVKKRVSPNRYTTNIKEDNARKVFTLLSAQGYISNATEVSAWLWVCGFDVKSQGKQIEAVKIDWLQGQNELAYFISGMFGKENQNTLWVIASRVFTIKGVDQKSGNLRAACSKLNIKHDKIVKLDKILKHR